MKRFYYSFLFIILISSCGKITETNDNINNTNEQIKETNGNISEVNQELKIVIDQLLNNEGIYVFKQDVISPLNKNLKPSSIPLKKSNGEVFQIEVEKLALFTDPNTYEEYYLVPSQYLSVLDKNSYEKIYAPNSFMRTIVRTGEDLVHYAVEYGIQVFLENKKIFTSLIAEAIELQERKQQIDECDKVIESWGQLIGAKQTARFHQWKRKAYIKNEIRKLEFDSEFIFCKKLRENKILTVDEIRKLRDKHQLDWDKFKTSWENYYLEWTKNSTIGFESYQSEEIFLPAIVDKMVIGIKEKEVVSYAERMKYMQLGFIKNKLLTPSLENDRDYERYKAFIISNSTGLEINPADPFSFEELTYEQHKIIQQMFKRALYSGNSKEETSRVLRFIAEAVFVMYERQLEERRIQYSLEKIKNITEKN